MRGRRRGTRGREACRGGSCGCCEVKATRLLPLLVVRAVTGWIGERATYGQPAFQGNQSEAGAA